jgi:hypothetical protein
MPGDSKNASSLDPWEHRLLLESSAVYVQAARNDPAGRPALERLIEKYRQEVEVREQQVRLFPMSDALRLKKEVALFEAGLEGIDHLAATDPQASIALMHIEFREMKRHLWLAERTLTTLDGE